ncbi:MAG: ribosomal large subunit pseudouridine synthase D [Deltaproteobacteria bacterium]|nr:MAG: ribosomal large subunit pseudouridine synthase D [Deltaproteobacteria bacterium]PIE73127.1 MAG: ribosomal large subunit pseudouridine synthase D [Deltaproteobacteria bacterium]
MDHQPFCFLVERRHAGLRFDKFVAFQLPSLSRSQICLAIENKTLTVDGHPKKNSYRLKAGETVSGFVAEEKPLSVCAEQIDFSILFEDQWLLFISKPPGLVVHPGPGNPKGTLVNGLVWYCASLSEVGDSIRPGLVHRLDKDTSGVMVVAKTNSVHRHLVEIFKNHRLHKEYLALVHGIPQERQGRVVGSIGRHPVHRQKMAVTASGGKYAVTNWQQLNVLADTFSTMRVVIETGRTHQIRVHLAHIGFPVAGDDLYGGSKDNSIFPRQMLHASRLAFEHPITGESLDVGAPVWPDMQQVLDRLKRADDG